MSLLPHRFPSMAWLAPGLSSAFVLANSLHLDIFQGINSRSSSPFAVTAEGFPPQEVDFTILDGTGRTLGPAEGGTIRLMRCNTGKAWRSGGTRRRPPTTICT